MPPTYTHEGAAAAVQLRADQPDLAILLLSQAIETHFAAQLFEQHGERFGYLLKDRVIDVVDPDARAKHHRCRRHRARPRDRPPDMHLHDAPIRYSRCPSASGPSWA